MPGLVSNCHPPNPWEAKVGTFLVEPSSVATKVGNQSFYFGIPKGRGKWTHRVLQPLLGSLPGALKSSKVRCGEVSKGVLR